MNGTGRFIHTKSDFGKELFYMSATDTERKFKTGGIREMEYNIEQQEVKEMILETAERAKQALKMIGDIRKGKKEELAVRSEMDKVTYGAYVVADELTYLLERYISVAGEYIHPEVVSFVLAIISGITKDNVMIDLINFVNDMIKEESK